MLVLLHICDELLGLAEQGSLGIAQSAGTALGSNGATKSALWIQRRLVNKEGFQNLPQIMTCHNDKVFSSTLYLFGVGPQNLMQRSAAC